MRFHSLSSITLTRTEMTGGTADNVKVQGRITIVVIFILTQKKNGLIKF